MANISYYILVEIRQTSEKAMNHGKFIPLFETVPVENLLQANRQFLEIKEKFSADLYRVNCLTRVETIVMGGIVIGGFGIQYENEPDYLD